MTERALAVDAWESLFRAQVAVLRQLTAEFPTTEISFTGKKVSPCGDDLAYYMDQYGVGPSKIPVTTYVIGFDVNNAAGSDAAKASALLQLIARAGVVTELDVHALAMLHAVDHRVRLQ